MASPLTRSARRQLLSPPAPASTTAVGSDADAHDTSAPLKRAGADRERLIQEYAAVQNGLAPAKRRRASRALSTTPSSTKKALVAVAADTVEEKGVDGPAQEEKGNEQTQKEENDNEKEKEEEPALATGEKRVEAAVATLSSEEKRLDGAPEGELFLVTVLSREAMQPSADAAAEAAMLAELLAQRRPETTADDAVVTLSWGKEYYAVESVRRLAIHHPKQLQPLLATALPLLVCPAASSLRSAMSRNALLCLQDVIRCLQDDAASVFDAVVPLLLTRASSEKHFIRELAREVLDTAVETCANEALLVNLLERSALEKNPQTLTVIGVYVFKCVVRLDSAILHHVVQTTHAAFVSDMYTLLRCKVVECKTAARTSLQHTRRVVGDAPFVALVKSKLTGSAQFDVLKASEPAKPAAKPAAAKLSMRDRMLQMRKQQQQHQQRPSAGASTDVVVVVAGPAPVCSPRASAATSSS